MLRATSSHTHTTPLREGCLPGSDELLSALTQSSGLRAAVGQSDQLVSTPRCRYEFTYVCVRGGRRWASRSARVLETMFTRMAVRSRVIVNGQGSQRLSLRVGLGDQPSSTQRRHHNTLRMFTQPVSQADTGDDCDGTGLYRSTPFWRPSRSVSCGTTLSSDSYTGPMTA